MEQLNILNYLKQQTAKEKAELNEVKKLLNKEARQAETEKRNFIKDYYKNILKAIDKEAKLKGKIIVNKMKEKVTEWETEIENKRDEKVTEILMRSGSWKAIYAALDGTKKGLEKAFPDLFRNITSHINHNARIGLVIDFNSKIQFNYRKLQGDADDIAMEVIGWLLKQEYFNVDNIYHTDYKNDNIKEIEKFKKDLNVYKFSTIVGKGIKKVIWKNYLIKYLSAENENGYYHAKVDHLDMSAKQMVLDNLEQEKIEAPRLDNEIEYLDINDDFRFKILADDLEIRTGQTLTENERAFLEMLGTGLNARNLEKYKITDYKYKTARRNLIKKGFLQGYSNVAKAVEHFKKEN